MQNRSAFGCQRAFLEQRQRVTVRSHVERNAFVQEYVCLKPGGVTPRKRFVRGAAPENNGDHFHFANFVSEVPGLVL